MKIYLAAASYRQKEIRNNYRKLTRRGFDVTSSWVFEKKLNDITKYFTESKRDLEQIDAADLLIIFTENPKAYHPKYTTGGRYVEMGYAIAKNKQILIVGPLENVFCWMGYPQFDIFKDVLVYLQNA